MIRLGVLGLASFYGPRYATRASERPDVSVTGVVPGEGSDDQLQALSRPTSTEFSETHDCAVYEDLDELLTDGDVDAVVVASRLGRRATDTIRALEAGCPVLSAKPAADDPQAAERIAATAETTGVPAITTSPMRFDDAVRTVKERISDGEIGDVHRIEISVQHDPVQPGPLENHPTAAPGEGGTAYSMGYYAADGLLWLSNTRPDRVFAEYTNRNTPHLDHPDLGTGTVRFANDSLGSMTMTVSTTIREYHQWEVEVVGSDGILTTQRTGYGGYHWKTAGDGPETFGRTLSPVLDRQFDAFIDAITGDGADVVGPDPTTVANGIALCSAWERAAETGSPVDLLDATE